MSKPNIAAKIIANQEEYIARLHDITPIDEDWAKTLPYVSFYDHITLKGYCFVDTKDPFDQLEIALRDYGPDGWKTYLALGVKAFHNPTRGQLRCLCLALGIDLKEDRQ